MNVNNIFGILLAKLQVDGWKELDGNVFRYKSSEWLIFPYHD